MHVRDIMTSDVVAIRSDASGADAAQLMWDHDCGVVPVIEAHNTVRAVVTDRDLCMAAFTRGTPLHEIPVGTVMSQRLFTCRAEDPIADAERTMARARVRRLPVVDGAGGLVGMLSLADIARARSQPGLARITEHVLGDVAETLAAVTRPGPSAEA
jgi:CBS domain-containing protein